MKKSILAIAAAAMFVMSACTEEKDIDLVAALNAEYEFDVTGSGAFQESGTISTSDLADISSNIDEELKTGVKRVSIEAIDVQLSPNANNSASTVSGSLEMTLNGSDVTIFENLSIGVNDEIVTLTELNPAGVSALKARLRALVIDGDVSEISGNVNGSVNGGTLDANLVITIRSSVVGTQSVELPNL